MKHTIPFVVSISCPTFPSSLGVCLHFLLFDFYFVCFMALLWEWSGCDQHASLILFYVFCRFTLADGETHFSIFGIQLVMLIDGIECV